MMCFIVCINGNLVCLFSRSVCCRGFRYCVGLFGVVVWCNFVG